MEKLAAAKELAKELEEARQAVLELRSQQAAAKAKVQKCLEEVQEAERGAKAKGAEAERYFEPDYWEERYQEEDGSPYEWYMGYGSELGSLMGRLWPKAKRGEGQTSVLVVGCGTSTVSEGMARDGFQHVVSIDTSESAISQMTQRAASSNLEAQLTYQVMDAAALSYEDGSFCGAVDKGTLDAVLSGKQGQLIARSICNEVMRVIACQGYFIVISGATPDRYSPLLSDLCDVGEHCISASELTSDAKEAVFAYVITKPALTREAGAREEEGEGAVMGKAELVVRQEGCEAIAVVKYSLTGGEVGGDRDYITASACGVEHGPEAYLSMEYLQDEAVGRAAGTVRIGLPSGEDSLPEYCIRYIRSKDGKEDDIGRARLAAVPVPRIGGRGSQSEAGLDGCQEVRRPGNVLVEQQLHIGANQLYLSKPAGWPVVDGSAACKQLADDCCLVTFVCLDGHGADRRKVGFRVVVQLKGRFDVGSARIQVNHDCVVVRVPCPAEARAVEHGGEEEIDVPELTGVTCRFCQHVLVSAGSLNKVLPLPSGRFDEVIDDMICFEGHRAVPMTAREVSIAQAGRCLVGDTFVLLHEQDMAPAALDEGEEVSVDDEGRPVYCGRCGTRLGSSSPGSTAVLMKHRILGIGSIGSKPEAEAAARVAVEKIQAGPGEDEAVEALGELLKQVMPQPGGASLQRCVPGQAFADITTQQWLMKELLRECEVERCYRFLVQSRGSKSRHLKVTVISPRCRVSLGGRGLPVQALKVSYHEVDSLVEDDERSKEILVEQDEYLDILSALNEACMSLPEMCRPHPAAAATTSDSDGRELAMISYIC